MRDTELIDGAVLALQRLGLGIIADVQTRPPRGLLDQHAVMLSITRGAVQQTFVVEARQAITTATLGGILVQLEQAQRTAQLPGLLLAEYIALPMAERLREHRQFFLDTVGNCYLETEAFLVYVAGRRPDANLHVTRGRQAFTPAGLKVLFALITDPDLAGAPQRTIAAAADVALGTVPNVLTDLRETGRLLQTAKTRRLHATKRLLDEWAIGYAQQLRPKTLLATYEAPALETWQQWPLDLQQVRWGGEPAAALLTRYLVPGVLTLYGDRIPPRLMIEQRLTPVGLLGAKQSLELRKPFWGKPLRHAGRPDTVAPALVYADLLATGEARCMETAGRLYDEHLARLFPAA